MSSFKIVPFVIMVLVIVPVSAEVIKFALAAKDGIVTTTSALGPATLKVASKSSAVAPSKTIPLPAPVNTNCSEVEISPVPVIVVPETAPVETTEVPLIVPPETLPVVVKFSSPKDIVPLLSVIEPSVSVKFPASTVAASTKGVVNSVVIVTFAGKPIVNVSVALTTASISFEVPKILIVSPAPTCCLVEEASSIKKPAAADT